ncbi:hypothetical protein [Nocardia rhizosphaerae]|uniref:Uncharacterized protein n=1 Tax=Nocardia rhizosphaerae TaxID=1691571 RepID=A0ABV8L6U1_9NOCA
MADAPLERLSVIAEQRWGLFTTAQAVHDPSGCHYRCRSQAAVSDGGVGAIERVAHGVSRIAGAPVAEHETIYAPWLALGGATAHRTGTGMAALVAAGTPVAAVHGIGDFLLDFD